MRVEGQGSRVGNKTASWLRADAGKWQVGGFAGERDSERELSHPSRNNKSAARVGHPRGARIWKSARQPVSHPSDVDLSPGTPVWRPALQSFSPVPKDGDLHPTDMTRPWHPKRGHPTRAELAGLVHEHAAVDVEDVAGDVGGGVGGEEDDGAGDFEVGAGAAEGDLGEHGLALLFVEAVSHGGFNKAGSDGVDGDAAGGDFAGERSSEADESGLAGGVVGLAGLAGAADDGGDVDDAAPAVFDHGTEQGLGEQEYASEVGREDVVPVGALHADGEIVAGDAGVVDEDFDFGEAVEDGFGSGLDGVFAGEIEGEGGGLTADRGDFGGDFSEFGFIAGGKRDGSAGSGKLNGAGAADALGGAGDERDAAGERRHGDSIGFRVEGRGLRD